MTGCAGFFPSKSRVRLSRYLDQFNPDAVLCTHYLPLWTLAAQKRAAGQSWVSGVDAGHKPPRKSVFVVSVVTDFDAHALWMNACVDLYCVAADTTKARLVARGVPEQNIAVTGIPIAPKFAQKLHMRTARRNLGLRSVMPIVLVLSGGFGMGAVLDTVLELDKTSGAFQIVVVCGRNEKLRAKLATHAFAHQTHVHGFVSNMHQLMAAANIIVTKAGGLTTSEALAMGRPMLIVNPIPGQESANSDFLLKHGAAVRANRPEDVPRKLVELLGSTKSAQMSRAARKLARPNAAFDVCREVITRLGITK